MLRLADVRELAAGADAAHPIPEPLADRLCHCAPLFPNAEGEVLGDAFVELCDAALAAAFAWLASTECYRHAEGGSAVEYAEEGIRWAMLSGDRVQIWYSHSALFEVAAMANELKSAFERHPQGFEAAEASGDFGVQCHSLAQRAGCCFVMGDFDTMSRTIDQALESLERQTDVSGEMQTLRALLCSFRGVGEFVRSDYEAALATFNQGLLYADDLYDPRATVELMQRIATGTDRSSTTRRRWSS